VTDPNPSNALSSSQIEYDHLLSYFKYLVTLTTIVVGLVIALGAYLFHSSMKDVREDAKQEATRVATSEAKARITEAFDEKNINAMILAAAQQKVGTITDKLIEQQLAEKLRPVQQRISVVGQVSESEMRMRMGFRSGLDELNRLLKSTSDPDVVRFGRGTLAIVSQDFDARTQEGVKKLMTGGKAMPALALYLMNQRRPPESVPSNLHSVVQVIHHDSDLNAVAFAFLAFRELTGASVKMFDFGEVEAWCSQNQPRCQAP
jgi:hypothetical protein